MDEQTSAVPESDPSTHFAPAERAPQDEVHRAAAEVTGNPVISALLSAFGGIVAVLNQHRQILAVNEGLLRFLGLEEGVDALGLRPGEALGCVHSEDWPGGCGTSRFCSTCGAAISIVLAQREVQPQDRECLLTIGEPGKERSVELKVRAVPLTLEGHPLVLLLLQDIREEKRKQAIERVFFHDLNNLLASLSGYSSILSFTDPKDYPRLVGTIESLCQLLADEIRSHTILMDAEQGTYRPQSTDIGAAEILRNVQFVFLHQTCSNGRTLDVAAPATDLVLVTDQALLTRILVNMVKNALEATPPGGAVRLWMEEEGSDGVFRVHNEGLIPEAIAMRVFQRHFSTKSESGRGLGTYGMKLLGERYLGGEVTFITSRDKGTTFSLRIPLEMAPADG